MSIMFWDKHIRFRNIFLSYDEFERNLEKESTPLFQHIRGRSPAVGPRLDNDNTIKGDVFAVETFFFNTHASKEQVEFYEYLRKNHPSQAFLYVLNITNSLEIWKKDVKYLSDFLEELKRDERKLTIETHDIRNLSKSENLLKSIPDILRKHFPNMFENLETEYLDLNHLIEDLRTAEKKMHSLKKFLEEYLEKLKERMPFLFKRTRSMELVPA